jgi:hypothetical protein
MSQKILLLASLALFLLQMLASPPRVSAAVTAGIFCNGDGGNNMGSPTDSPSGLTTSQINGFRASGMTTMILFQMSVLTDGDFVYDGQTICSGGSYVGTSNWGSLLSQCRVAPSGINRIEICLGGAGDASWTDIKNLITNNGTNSTAVLYQNLSALRNALGIDAIDSDDELTYDSASAIQFGQMCAAVGLHLTLCPYTNKSYWHAVQSALGSNICDLVYLQCYQGGAGNDPANWASSLGVPVSHIIPGYWDNERDATFLTNMLAWSKEGCTGGWLWPTCEQCTPPAGPGEMLQYAGWMLASFDPIVTPVAAVDVVGSQVAFSGSFSGNNTYQWQVIKAGVTNNIPGSTNVTLTLANLQLTNTASYQLLASNASGVFSSGTSSLTVSSTPSPVNNVIASYAAQTGLGDGFTLTPTWTIAPGSVIYGQAPGVTNGNFSEFADGQNVNSLSAGGSLTISQVNSFTNGDTTSPNYVTCGNGTGPDGSNAGATIIYTLTNSSAVGYNLTNITVYGGWKDNGRDQQAYTVYYSIISAPATFILLGSVNYTPANAASVQCATRATLTPATGSLAANVAAVKFDFTSPASENGWCGYAQIALYGTPLAPVVATNTLPVTAVDVVGSQVTFIASVVAGEPLVFQWQKISGGVTNNVPGATNTTLTLANLQLTNTASYQLQASNAYGVVVTTPSSLTVSSVSAAVNNVITELAAQTGPGPSDIPGTTFTPTWTVTTNNSLIAGQSPSTALGNFSVPTSPGASVNFLTAGGNGAITVLGVLGNTSCSTNYVTCGNGSGAGSLIIYTLTGATQGYNLTNLTVYGGWTDDGRDQQAYTVYYSTIAAPTSFIQLSSVNYLPTDPSSVFSATRVTLVPASGALATNVAAVKFDFTTPTSENGYQGYSEINLYGVPAVATNPTNIAVQLTNNNMTLSWPANHIGWQLQTQSNSLAQGLGTNWVNVSGSTLTNQVSFPINPTAGDVLYRLIYPSGQ